MGKQVVEALLRARRSIGGTVFKAGFNQAQKYPFVGHEQVIEKARGALLGAGLVLVEEHVEHVGSLAYQASSGKETLVWRWRGAFRLVHESGEEWPSLFVVEATTGTNDKAAFVASTALDRTAHLRVLELAGSEEEDPEHDSHDRDHGGPAAADLPAQDIARAKAALAAAADPVAVREWVRKTIRAIGEPSGHELWKAYAARCGELSLQPREELVAARGGE